MGPDVAVELANNAGKHGPQISIPVGDNDSPITKKVRDCSDKWSDIVPSKRSMVTNPYSLQAKLKRVLSNKVIDYLLKCFGYAQYRKTENQSEIKIIVPHAFGHHEY